MKKYLLLAATTALLAGCTAPDVFNENGTQGYNRSVNKDSNMIEKTHKAAESLMSQAAYLKNDLKPVLITSVAKITDLDSTSALGLAVSEQIGNRLSQYGFPVIDLRTRKDIKIRENAGEFMLSRDIMKISKQHSAGAVLVGTYARGTNTVYISTRLIRPEDNRVLASYDFGLPMGPDIQKLVRTKAK